MCFRVSHDWNGASAHTCRQGPHTQAHRQELEGPQVWCRCFLPRLRGTQRQMQGPADSRPVPEPWLRERGGVSVQGLAWRAPVFPTTSHRLLVLSWAGVAASRGGDTGEVPLEPMSRPQAGQRRSAALRRASARGWHGPHPCGLLAAWGGAEVGSGGREREGPVGGGREHTSGTVGITFLVFRIQRLVCLLPVFQMFFQRLPVWGGRGTQTALQSLPGPSLQRCTWAVWLPGQCSAAASATPAQPLPLALSHRTPPPR